MHYANELINRLLLSRDDELCIEAAEMIQKLLEKISELESEK